MLLMTMIDHRAAWRRMLEAERQQLNELPRQHNTHCNVMQRLKMLKMLNVQASSSDRDKQHKSQMTNDLFHITASGWTVI